MFTDYSADYVINDAVYRTIMKTVSTLIFCLTLTSVVFAELRPIGSLGKGELRNITFLPDGRILRVLSNRIELADPNTGETIERFADRTVSMGNVTVSRDSLRLAIVRTKRSALQTAIEIWELASQRKILQRTIPLTLYHTALSPNLMVFAGHDEGIIRLWRVETGESLGEIKWTDQPSFVRLAFNPDGRQLLSINSYISRELPGGDDHWETIVDVWDIASHQRLWSHTRSFRAIRAIYSPDGRWIVMADTNDRIQFWDAKLGTQQLVLHVTGNVQKMRISPDSKRIYIASGTGGYPRQPNRVSIWDIETGEQLKELGDETLGIKGLTISPDETHAVLWYYNGFVSLWDIQQRRRLALQTDYVFPRWGAVTPDGHYLVSLSGPALTIWNLRSQKLQEIISPDDYFFRHISMSPHGQTFAVDRDPWIEIRETRSGKVLLKVPNEVGSTPYVFSNDGRRLAVGQHSSVVIYNLHNPDKREELLPKEQAYISERHIVFSPDDRYLAVSDWDNEVHLWENNMDRYVHRYSWQIPASQIDDIEFEPKPTNPALVVIGNGDELQVWELGDTAPKQSMRFNASAPIHFVHGGAESLHLQRDYLFVNHGGRLQIWDWAIKTPVTAPDIPRYFAANRDGSVVVARDYVSDQTRIWNVRQLIFPKPILLGEVRRTALLANFPNPLNPETWIPYQLAESANVQIHIYDVAGQLVQTLDLGTKLEGSYLSRESAAYWDGRNNMGEAVGSGTYFYTLETGDFRTTRRVTVVK
ncbi:MAG: T9SS type A sorting domain-containing protein [Candidatus Poribacteria bacterium]|nr:T9SS type A sorting domain-containing protein [Candidatus Poribacteria bacterium]